MFIAMEEHIVRPRRGRIASTNIYYKHPIPWELRRVICLTGLHLNPKDSHVYSNGGVVYPTPLGSNFIDKYLL